MGLVSQANSSPPSPQDVCDKAPAQSRYLNPLSGSFPSQPSVFPPRSQQDRPGHKETKFPQDRWDRGLQWGTGQDEMRHRGRQGLRRTAECLEVETYRKGNRELVGNSLGQLPAEPSLLFHPPLPFFKVGSCYIAQTDLEFANLQLQPPERWHCRPMPPCPDSTLRFLGEKLRTRSWGDLQECVLF